MTNDGHISDRTWGMLMVELTDIKDGQKEIKTLVLKQNSRIGKLENWRAWITGALAVITVIGGIVIKLLN